MTVPPVGDSVPASPVTTSPAQVETDAINLVKRGVIAGYVLAAMNAFLAWYIYDTGYGVHEAAGDDRSVIAASNLFMAFVAAGLAFLFGRRHANGIPIFFLAWVAFEVIAKMFYLRGGPNAGYLLSAGLLVFGLISGLRGALALRKLQGAAEVTNSHISPSK